MFKAPSSATSKLGQETTQHEGAVLLATKGIIYQICRCCLYILIQFLDVLI